MSTVVVAGEALVDLVIGPDGSVLAAPGGGPFNTARTIARLGVPTAFLGALAMDAFGRRLRSVLEEDGVDLAAAVPTELPTTLALAEVDAEGGATYRFYVDGTSAPSLHQAELPAGAVALHVGTLGLRLEPVATALEALALAAPDPVLVMLDVNARPSAPGDDAGWRARVRRVAARADVIKASVEDLVALGLSAPDLLDLGPAAILVTDGPRPVTVSTREGVTTVDVPRVDVVDTVGAGDAFGGGFLAWWIARGASRADLSRLVTVAAGARAATEVAARTCGRAGAEPPRREEVTGFGRC